MARTLLAHACLLATLVVAGAMPSLALSDIDMVKGPACMKAGSDNGIKGTHISCSYSCGPNALLIIGAEASDKDADVYGNTECGEASVSCMGPSPLPVCADKSDGLTLKSQSEAKCSGATHEAFDSPMIVACIATVDSRADPQSAVCQYAGIGCAEGSGPTGPTLPPAPQPTLMDLCVPTGAVGPLVASLVAFVEGLVPNGKIASSFIVFTSDPADLVAVSFDGEVCTSEVVA